MALSFGGKEVLGDVARQALLRISSSAAGSGAFSSSVARRFRLFGMPMPFERAIAQTCQHIEGRQGSAARSRQALPVRTDRGMGTESIVGRGTKRLSRSRV